MKCEKCGKIADSVTIYEDGTCLCDECKKESYLEELDRKAEAVHSSCDFKSWKGRDMAELFWLCLGRYVKEPTKRDLDLINQSYLWAVHDNHALAVSMSHALKWAGVNIAQEKIKFLKEK